ncbi:MAG TPA: PIN domain-containing protein [Chloroflexota bacterium]|nr:PIN domain-containing protein [Chloroflexota bacterium]
MNEGLIDTNVFIHALSHDQHAEHCQQHLRALADGRAEAILDAVVVHELTYVLPRFVKSMTRSDVAQYLISIISWNGVIAEKELLTEAVRLWAAEPVGFTDAYLAARAVREGCPVYTRNVADLRRCGAAAPDLLPS